MGNDLKGLATGGSISYLFFNATVAKSNTYYAVGGGFGLGYGVKGNWNGTFSYGYTFLIGEPYRRSPVNFTRSYINTMNQRGL